MLSRRWQGVSSAKPGPSTPPCVRAQHSERSSRCLLHNCSSRGISPDSFCLGAGVVHGAIGVLLRGGQHRPFSGMRTQNLRDVHLKSQVKAFSGLSKHSAGITHPGDLFPLSLFFSSFSHSSLNTSGLLHPAGGFLVHLHLLTVARRPFLLPQSYILLSDMASKACYMSQLSEAKQWQLTARGSCPDVRLCLGQGTEHSTQSCWKQCVSATPNTAAKVLLGAVKEPSCRTLWSSTCTWEIPQSIQTSMSYTSSLVSRVSN